MSKKSTTAKGLANASNLPEDPIGGLPIPEKLEEVTPETQSDHRFECRSCGYIYDPIEGVKKVGINSGTPFEAIDQISFRCPVCRASAESFKDIGIRSKPSGFEENLKYGFANNLTPGQKNVLIFGGLAFVFACFLSLYALR